MSDASGQEEPVYQVSGDVARLAHLLRVAAHTTRLLASAAGANEQVMWGLAARVDDIAEAYAAVGRRDCADDRRS